MEWWQGFWGWAVTAALAAIAAVGVVMQELRHWRARPWGAFEIQSLGTIDISGSPAWKMFRVTNTGTLDIGIVQFSVLGAEMGHPQPDPEEYVIPRALRVGESRKFAVRHAPTERAWAFVIADHPRNRAATILTWQPLEAEGPLAEEYGRQLDHEMRFWRRVTRGKRRDRRPVGPGGVASRTISPKTRQSGADIFVAKYPERLA